MQADKIILGALALLATGFLGFTAGKSAAQDASPALVEEHRLLDAFSGDYTAEVGGMLGESEGTSRVESTSLGGIWSVQHFESSLMGQPYTGLEIVGYDPLKQKYVSVWVDSLTPLLLVMEGDYDADSKTLTMKGQSRGMDGEVAEMVNTLKLGEHGKERWEMNIEGMAAPMMTIDYTRKE